MLYPKDKVWRRVRGRKYDQRRSTFMPLISGFTSNQKIDKKDAFSPLMNGKLQNKLYRGKFSTRNLCAYKAAQWLPIRQHTLNLGVFEIHDKNCEKYVTLLIFDILHFLKFRENIFRIFHKKFIQSFEKSLGNVLKKFGRNCSNKGERVAYNQKLWSGWPQKKAADAALPLPLRKIDQKVKQKFIQIWCV